MKLEDTNEAVFFKTQQQKSDAINSLYLDAKASSGLVFLKNSVMLCSLSNVIALKP